MSAHASKGAKEGEPSAADRWEDGGGRDPSRWGFGPCLLFPFTRRRGRGAPCQEARGKGDFGPCLSFPFTRRRERGASCQDAWGKGDFGPCLFFPFTRRRKRGTVCQGARGKGDFEPCPLFPFTRRRKRGTACQDARGKGGQYLCRAAWGVFGRCDWGGGGFCPDILRKYLRPSANGRDPRRVLRPDPSARNRHGRASGRAHTDAGQNHSNRPAVRDAHLRMGG